MLLCSVLVLLLTEDAFSESPQAACALSGRLYGGVLRRQWGDHMRDLIRGRGFRWVWLEWHYHHQQLWTRRGSRWVLAYHPSVSWFFFFHVQMWMISLLITFSSCPQPLLLITIGPVWKALLINPVRHKLALVMSPFFVIYAECSDGRMADVSLSLCFKSYKYFARTDVTHGCLNAGAVTRLCLILTN